jgi:tRNA:m(5)U-54 methyltransferase
VLQFAARRRQGQRRWVLKLEMECLGSLVIRAARAAAVPAGGALAVDRQVFSSAVTEAIEGHSGIRVIREEVTALPDGPTILATGPLTSRRCTHPWSPCSARVRWRSTTPSPPSSPPTA